MMIMDIIEFLYNCEMVNVDDCYYDKCKYIKICELRERNDCFDIFRMIYTEGEN